jgi:hypothetical protein
MSTTTKKLTFVLLAVFSVLVAGAALSGCDSGKPPEQNNTGLL